MTDYKDTLDLEEVLGRAHLNTRYLYDDLYKFFKSRVQPEFDDTLSQESYSQGYDEGVDEGKMSIESTIRYYRSLGLSAEEILDLVEEELE